MLATASPIYGCFSSKSISPLSSPRNVAPWVPCSGLPLSARLKKLEKNTWRTVRVGK